MPTFSMASAKTPKPSTGSRMTALTARQTCRYPRVDGQSSVRQNVSVFFGAYRRHVVQGGDRVEPKALQQTLHKHQSATLDADGKSLIPRKESEWESSARIEYWLKNSSGFAPERGSR